ncbi:uncharacterized protein LOC144633255 [Oculina patagonica]
MPILANRSGLHVSRIVLVAVFVIASALIEESEQLISPSTPAESLCLRRCRLRAEKRSNTKVSRFTCYHRCINKMTKVTDQQDLTAKVFKQRIRKALKPVPDCRDSSPDQTVDWTPSEVNVTFGKYENTSHWYVNVSWTPINDSSGNWTGILIRLVVMTYKPDNTPEFPLETICSAHPKNRTFLNINISSHQYKYPDPIFLKVLAFPYSTKEDISSIQPYDPPTPAPQPTEVQTTAVPSSTVNLTTGLPPTTAAKSNCSLNEMEYGDLEWNPSNVEGRFLQRRNGDWFANISWTPLTNSTVTWKGYFLSIFFGSVSEKGYGIAKCFKVPKYQTSFIVDSSHGWKYPQSISVSVTAYPFRRLTVRDMDIISTTATAKTTTTKTTTPKTTTATTTIKHNTTVKLPPTVAAASPTTPVKSDVITTVFASVGGLFVLVIAVLVAFRCRKPSAPIPVVTQRRYKYHAFIIFNTSDCEDFVKNILIPTLERHYFKYCIHWKDWVPGEVITKNIVNSVYNSFKIIALVSKNFVTSNPCIYELDQAEHRLMNEHDDCLILFKFDDVEIPSTLLNRSYIDFTKATDISTWESRLVDVLKTAEVMEDESLYSEGNVNNNLSADNSELVCSCQTVNEVLSMEEVIPGEGT